MCAFSTSLTTTVFSQRSMWRFETVPHRTIPEGQQSSIFHRALIPPSDCLPTTRFLIRGAPEVECTRERASKRWLVRRHAEHPRDSRLRDWMRHTCRMAGGSPQLGSREWFTTPHEVNHRRYEALRAFFVEGLTHAAAGERFGYTRWAMVNLVREHRAGRTELFAPARKPGPAPGSAPAKDRARARVIELRRAGLSTYEISARLPGEGTPLNRTSVAEILAEEGFGRLLRRPEPAESTSPATPGRDTRLPRTARLDFATWPATVETGKAGLLLLVPDLIALDLPALVTQAGYPGTRVVPAVSWLLSLLALKLTRTRTRRVSHVDDLLLADPAAALFAGLSTLPKKSALTDYSYRTSHEH